MNSPLRSEPLDLTGRRLFITGGTGFVGRSLLDYVAESAAHHGRSPQVCVLSRDPARFLRRFPEYALHPWLSFVAGDLDALPAQGEGYTDLIHAAADTHRSGDALAWLDQLVGGTRRVLDFARAAGVQRLLLASSSAVYGRQDPDAPGFDEAATRAPSATDTGAVYAHGKRLAELLCALAFEQTGLRTVMARYFALISRHVPLDGPYAAGNFMRDALHAEAITVQGAGDTVRSYMAGRDMAHWSFTLLARGEPGQAYNVGSEQPVTMHDLALATARLLAPGKPVRLVAAAGALPSVYLPCTTKARRLGLRIETGLDQAIVQAARGRA